MLKPFIELIRPKTLPLALSVILVGNALALWRGEMRFIVFFLEIVTACALQILSNIANDYGDGIRGTDAHRQGPRRMLQSGMMRPAFMRALIIFFAAFSFTLGVLLIIVARRSMAESLTIFTFGVIAIIAAITYTVGRYAYGYHALGEAAVFVFFGLLGVAGSYTLQTSPLFAGVWLAAAAAGLLASAVLNINNLRDIDSDAAGGRKTVAVYLGSARGKRFHFFLLAAGFACYALFALLYAWQSALWLLLTPVILRHGKNVHRADNSAAFGAELRNIVLINLATALLFAAGLFFA